MRELQYHTAPSEDSRTCCRLIIKEASKNERYEGSQDEFPKEAHLITPQYLKLSQGTSFDLFVERYGVYTAATTDVFALVICVFLGGRRLGFNF